MINNPNNPSAGSPSQGDATSQLPQAQGAASPSQGDQSSTTGQPRSVEELERMLSEFKRDNAMYRKKAHEHELAIQQAEEQRQKEQGQWKDLAEKHETRVKELEPIASRYTQLADLVGVQIETEIKDWPPEVKTFDPGANAPIEQRLEWRNKSRPLIDKLVQQAQGQLPGNRPNPSPQGGRSFEERVTANMAELKKQRTYGI